MIVLKKGSACGIRITPVWDDGTIIDVRKGRSVLVQVVTPSGSVKTCGSAGIDIYTGAVFARLGAEDLNTVGSYGLIVNVQTQDGDTICNTDDMFVQVVEESDSIPKYESTVVSLRMKSVELPNNPAVRGGSPMVGANGDWLIYNDAMKKYVNSGVRAIKTVNLTTHIKDNELYVYQDSIYPGKATLRFVRNMSGRQGYLSVKKWRIFDPETCERYRNAPVKYNYLPEYSFKVTKEGSGETLLPNDLWDLVFKGVMGDAVFIHNGRRGKWYSLSKYDKYISLKNFGLVLVDENGRMVSNIATFGVSARFDGKVLSRVAFCK